MAKIYASRVGRKWQFRKAWSYFFDGAGGVPVSFVSSLVDIQGTLVGVGRVGSNVPVGMGKHYLCIWKLRSKDVNVHIKHATELYIHLPARIANVV